MADLKIKQIKTSDNTVHEIDAKYWGGHDTSDLKTINGEQLLSDNGGNIQITAETLGLSAALKYCGITTTKLTDGATTNPVVIGNTNHTATSGCVVFYEDKEGDKSTTKEFVFNGSNWELLGSDVTYKVVQNKISSPEMNGEDIAFIDTIEQDANGVITATKKEVRNATKNQKGAVKLVEGDMNGKLHVDGQAPSLNHTHSQYVEDTEMVIVKGVAENSAILDGEYEGYSNKAISQVSVAVGAASTSGLKGWYYDAITFDDTNKVYKIYIKYQNKIANGTGITTTNNTTTQPKLISTSSGSTNSSFKSGYAVGDVISLVNDKKYEDCSTITAINGNVLTVDKLPFTKEDMKTSSMASVIGYEAPDEFSIYCIKREFNDNTNLLTLSKYDNGDVDFGGGSLSEGVQTYAVNIGAHAEGAQTVAKGQYSHAEGIRTIANYASHAEGRDTTAMGSSSHAEGRQTQAIGSSSHAEGDNTTASGSQAHSEGQNTIASGNHSHAEGYNTNAINNQAHAEGGSTTASGKQSHAEGWSTTAAGDHSHAEGGYCQALKKQSHAGGNNSIADGTRSFAHGHYAITTKADEVAFGKYNKSESDTLFSIGNGTDENNRSNILEVKSIENDSEVKYEYFAPSGDITFYYNEYDENDNYRKAMVVSYYDAAVGGEYARYKVEYIVSTSDYPITNFVGGDLYTPILNIKQSDGFLYLPLDIKPQCEIDLAEREQDCADLINHDYRCLYISTDFTEENAIFILDYSKYTINVVRLQYSEHKTNNSALFVNGQRVLVEGSVNESKDWSDDINNAKKQAISESNTYTDSKVFISRNTSSTGIIDTGCIYKGEEIKNVAKGCGSVAIGAGVLSKSDGSITLGWSDIKTISSDSTLSTNDDYLNKWKELTNITDETIGSTTQSGFSASLGNNSVSLGRSNLTVGPQSVSIGMRNLSIGNHAVAMGGYNIARGNDSVAMGQGCITNNTSNRGEFACGRFNKSVSDTQFSLGIGTSATKRKNALEIKTNGKHYIYGVGGYDGTNPNESNDIATVISNISKDIDGIKPSNMIEIDYDGLKYLRDNSKLVPGGYYRITDYVTTTTQNNTKSAGNLFDVIVLALNENTLSEEAYAINSERDIVKYFGKSNLSAWKLWYCLDNDPSRFGWADESNGKGVIYRMIDEFGNDCPYDFKNIQFRRSVEYGDVLKISKGNDYAYTFCFVGYSYNDILGDSDSDGTNGSYDNKEWGDIEDGSLYPKVHNNVMKSCHSVVMDDELYRDPNILYLNDNVISSYWDFNTDDGGCYNNTLGFDCCSNSFDSNCYSNILGNDCCNNTFGFDCCYNILDNKCHNNILNDVCENKHIYYAEYDSDRIEIQDGVLKVGSIVINGYNYSISGLEHVVTNTISTNSDVSVGGKLNIAGLVTASSNIVAAGTITSTGFYQSSDERLKTFTSDYDINLDDIKNIKTGKFYWNSDENQVINGGVSAQTVEEYFPELVNEDENGFKSVNYDGLAVVAIAAIKKLTDRIEQLEEIVRNK